MQGICVEFWFVGFEDVLCCRLFCQWCSDLSRIWHGHWNLRSSILSITTYCRENLWLSMETSELRLAAWSSSFLCDGIMCCTLLLFLEPDFCRLLNYTSLDPCCPARLYLCIWINVPDHSWTVWSTCYRWWPTVLELWNNDCVYGWPFWNSDCVDDQRFGTLK